MYLTEIPMGTGDVATIERIASQLLIAKQIEKVRGEVPVDFAFYKSLNDTPYEPKYTYNLMLEDLAEAIDYLGFGECVYDGSGDNEFYILFSLPKILEDVDFSDLFDSEEYSLSWEEEEYIRWENGLLVAEIPDFEALPYEITGRIIEAYKKKSVKEEK